MYVQAVQQHRAKVLFPMQAAANLQLGAMVLL
jgi:hypothetical protein